jgi:hypothetical protein
MSAGSDVDRGPGGGAPAPSRRGGSGPVHDTLGAHDRGHQDVPTALEGLAQQRAKRLRGCGVCESVELVSVQDDGKRHAVQRASVSPSNWSKAARAAACSDSGTGPLLRLQIIQQLAQRRLPGEPIDMNFQRLVDHSGEVLHTNTTRLEVTGEPGPQ